MTLHEMIAKFKERVENNSKLKELIEKYKSAQENKEQDKE